MIGLKRGTVALYPHTSEWDINAAETIRILKQVLGDVALDIRHVGSTSIQTIKAKPIIDIAVAVRKLDDIIPLVSAMKDHGFHRKDVGDGWQVFFSAGDFEQDIRTHHIHVVEYESMEWRNYLNFTAYLNTFPDVARIYEARKEELLAQYPNDRTAYTEGKAELITYLLRKAMVWSYLGKTVTLSIDRPIGYVHKKDIVYPINYGYIPGVLGGDGEELDVYLLGITEPVQSYTARIVAIVHRENDIEDKLVAVPCGIERTQEEIAEQVYFQEKYYDSYIEIYCDGLSNRRERIKVRAPQGASVPNIRPMNEEESAVCASVVRAAFMTVAEQFGFTRENAPRFTAFAVDEARLKWQHREGRPMFVLFDEKEEPIGFYSLCPKSADTVELNNLSVLPAYRHHKYGEKLLIHALREAMVRGYRYMTIGIVEENRVLREWYEKYGFVHVGTEKFEFFPFTCGYMTKNLFGEDG